MNTKLERLVRLVEENPIAFERYSRDVQQINPLSRVYSIATIINNLDIPKESTILDVGTGYGYGAVLLNALGHTVIGIDFNGDKLRNGLEYWNKLGVDFKLGDSISQALGNEGKLYFSIKDSRNLEAIPKKSIDMITSFYISGYMAGRKGAFRAVDGVLKPGGNLLVTTEGPIQVPSFLRGLAASFASNFPRPE